MKRHAERGWPALALLVLLAPNQAVAYIGPGGGLALLSTALAMLAAFSVSAVVVFTWPIRAIRRWLKRRREPGQEGADES